MNSNPLPPWEGPLPVSVGRLETTLIVPVPTGANQLVHDGEALAYLEGLRSMLEKCCPGDHEILLVPYGEAQTSEVGILSRLVRVTASRKGFRWIPGLHSGPGSAVRDAVFRSEGRKILVANLEYRYDLSFFQEALRLLGAGWTGVWANRRLPESEFTVPVTLLFLVFRRHLWGTFLGRLWSRCFALSMGDSLSGAYSLRRDFALPAFAQVTCREFLYGAELALLAGVNDRGMVDLAVHFQLVGEKSRRRVWKEVVYVLRWTWRFWRALGRGEYEFPRPNAYRLTADDWGLSPGVNEGILELAKSGHLRRVSILGGGKFSKHRLAELKRIPGVEFSLHFNLTNPEGGGIFPSLKHFLWAWLTDRGLVQKARRALRDQLVGLRRAGIRVRHLDGHQHCHAVPGLLEGIADILREVGIRSVRVPYHQSLWWGRRAPIAWLGWSIGRSTAKLGFESEAFDYPNTADFLSFNRLVGRLNRASASEVLVHPARRNDIAEAAPSDGYREGRVREFLLLRMLALTGKRPPRLQGSNQKIRKL